MEAFPCISRIVFHKRVWTVQERKQLQKKIFETS